MWVLGLALIAVTGCVERKLFVRSEPEGASVFVDGTYRGQTPLEVPFTTYGTRELTLRATGHRTLQSALDVDPPWYAYPGLDLITEVLIPVTIEDRREVFVRLGESGDGTDTKARAELIERAESVRSDAR